MRALVTGFEPFMRWRVNSSAVAAEALGREGVEARVLPVDHRSAAEALGAALDAARPDALLAMGLADRPAPELELLARRPAHAAEGPLRLAGLWPWAAALAAMRGGGAPARLSDDAGRYVCETVYWTALARRAAGQGVRLVAFLHLPPLSDAWPAERLAAAARACLDAARVRAPVADAQPSASPRRTRLPASDMFGAANSAQ